MISVFVFTTRIVQFLFYLNPKFQASSSFLCLYRSVCVGPVRKPHCWFSHEAAHSLFCPERHVFTLRLIFEPRREKPVLRGFRPGPTRIGLCSYRKKQQLETGNLDISRRWTVIRVAKTKALISCADTA